MTLYALIFAQLRAARKMKVLVDPTT